MGTEDDAIEQAVEERRERLRALKTAHELPNTPDDEGENETSQENKKSMGKIGCDDERRQDVLDFKCKKIINHNIGAEKSTSPPPSAAPLPKKSATVGTDTLDSQIVSPTPERIDKRPLRTKYKDEGSLGDLPEKYRTIVDFFDRMICSLRLLGLRKKPSTFQNISTLVEVLTNRKFSYNHLAQMKYILPEAIQIDKILVHDEKSLCMKPDMKISLLFDAIEGHQEKSAFIALLQLFTTKILNFINTHPEDCDLPEAMLPVLSNQRNQMTIPEALRAEALLQPQQTPANMEAISDLSHLNSTFSRHFSSKIPMEETESTQVSLSPVQIVQQKDSIESYSKSTFTEAPKLILPQYSVSPIACESPFEKITSVAGNSMVETPAQSTPKRSMPKCDNILKSISVEKGTSCQKPAKRYIDFSHFEGDEGEEFLKIGNSTNPKTDETEGSSADETVTGYPTVFEKIDGSKRCSATKHEMNQTGLIMCQEMRASLPDLVTLIHHIFQSTSCSSITKEELVHKIIMSDCDIIERREVEEQIEHLEKQVPDWICRRVTHSGDVFYNIRKVLDLDRVRARLISM